MAPWMKYRVDEAVVRKACKEDLSSPLTLVLKIF
jgi:hypothetical protein